MNREEFFQRALLLFSEKIFDRADQVPTPAQVAAKAEEYARALHDTMLLGLTRLDIDEEVKRHDPVVQAGTPGVPTLQPTRLSAKKTPHPLQEELPPCSGCGAPTKARTGQFGPFLGCSTYPTCRTITKG